ncbi:procollagen-lysine,2-oxoglutarate 5-dioxygenase 2-like [Penaeus indicus]|uniref:procollagen-lysine,2-oxoglutarate 5-dioxygenase 2-like n=1 Tax=Penaeus indicus TaxID=29960 RepID=UPI00300DBA5E
MLMENVESSLPPQRLISLCISADVTLPVIRGQVNVSIVSQVEWAGRPVVGPLLFQRKTKESNLLYSEETPAEWQRLIRRQKVRGVFMVEEVRHFNLIQRDYINAFAEGEEVGRYVDTRINAGTVVDPRGHKEGKRNPDLWGIKDNNYMWTKRYIHPDLLRIIRKEVEPEEIAAYLYYVPFYSEAFCREIVEEMEYYGKWQDGEEDTRDVAHQYTSRNINLEDIDFDSEYFVILNSLHKELLASLYSDYRAYAEPSLIFVLKYADNTKYNTFKYHLDGASYTYNIALNNDFTGGGLEYRMGNRYFGEEKEFHVPHNRTGWAVIQPNRPLHVHRGVPLESGTRYAMINIIETNDAGSKGGPTWIVS